MTLKRTMCALLAASMLTTGVVAAQSSASAAEVENESGAAAAEESGASYGLPTSIKDGNILHALNWKLSDIQAEAENIAKAGFVAVQTSPIQAHDGSGHWYWLYQPINFWPGNELGSEDDLKSLCAEAEKYGLQVIVDVVANHFAGNHSNIPDELKGSEYYHNSGYGTSDGQMGVDWNNRWQVTHCDIGMPDLNSENGLVQQYVLNYVKELKACGVDGIRWDAAKHIGLPSEGCEFWKTVTSQGLYNYGEILDSPGGDGAAVMKEYTQYMSVTDNQYGNNMRGSIQGGSVMSGYGNWTAQGVDAKGIVYWAESHDTFFNGQESQSANTNQINRTYAAVACRYGSQALYMSRPTGAWGHNQAGYGEKGDISAATSKEVAAVNHFRNAMGSKKDYYLSDNGCAVITRQGGGAVIVKASGSGDVTVKNGGGYATPGTYKDEITGNTFTVTGSTISGNIGDTGIAVIYDGNPLPDTDTSTVEDTDTSTKPVTGVNVYFDNSAYNWSNVYAYVYDESTGTARNNAAWPGVRMTDKNSEGYYVLNVDSFANGMVIFNDGTGSATNRYPADMQPGLKIENSSKLFGANHSWTAYTEKVDTSTDTSKDTSTDTSKDTSTDTSTEKKVKVLVGDANQDGKVSLRDASLALKASVGNAKLSTNAALAADADGDGTVSSADALAIQKYDVGIASGNIGKTVEKTVA
ncbi:MAG: starch-binding protein [Ruminococcus sp.]|nr:starch-binding protein [Ruminococcus sp.]